MSASPSGGPNGQRPTPPPGAPPLRRPRNTANPLVPRKRPIQRPPPSKLPPSAKGTFSTANSKLGAKQPQRPASGNGGGPPNFDHLRRQNGGWSMPKPEGASDYPLYVTKKDLKEGLRFHVMRFMQNPPPEDPNDPGMEPLNQYQFTRPVTLQRRDPRQPAPGREVKEEEIIPEEPPVVNEEAEKLAQLKAERAAQRAIDDAQKAPVAKDAVPKAKENKKQEEKQGKVQTHYQPRTEKQKKERDIRYEESLPWHLEDADGKNVWVGQYEAPLSESKVALMISNGGFRMLPLEKWYRFTSKRGSFKPLSIEEAERAMNKKAAPGRWAKRDEARERAERAMAESRMIVNGRTAVRQESETFRSVSRREKADHDDIDMSGDEFQDDDETAGYEPDRDDDTKDSKERVRRDQLGANLFGDADEQKVEKEFMDELKEDAQRKQLGAQVKKRLRKVDQQYQYESDSSSNRDPFASSSSESEDEIDLLKKAAEEKAKEKDKDQPAASGSSSKGTNTPQGKKAAAEAAKKGKSLKRAGSPIVSDSSGTESVRKKKKTGPTTSMPGSRGTTPLPGGQRGRTGAGSTSDGEGTAGEMSDGAGGKKRRRPLGTGARGTPAGSRAGSPAPLVTAQLASGARPGSPGAPSQSPTRDVVDRITAQEIIDALPPLPQGISIGALLKVFMHRLDKPGHMSRKEWLKLVKENANFNQQEKLLRRKG
ncbi:hypothetical protein F4778DRAFT_745135 [Xylariomycetidae sp. FL2044]|nr:hypothetical protein F4778DRAFT_745135 [Xylariomycetidae sp. FL2044]